MKKEKGITMVALVITIILLILLSSTTINFSVNLIQKVKITSFIIDIQKLEEKFVLYEHKAKMKNINYDIENLNWDGINTPENTAKIENDESEDNISIILETIPKKLENKFYIKNGKIIYCNLSEEEKNAVLQIGKEVDGNYESGPAPLFKFATGNLTFNNDQISINSQGDGTIILNGTITSGKYFIKLIDDLDVKALTNSVSSSKIFEEWQKDKQPFVKANTKIFQKVEIISGTYEINEQYSQTNFMARDGNDGSNLACKLQTNLLYAKSIIKNDLYTPYIYLSNDTNSADNLKFNNLKIKITYQTITISEMNKYNVYMSKEEENYSGLNCIIDEECSIKLDGKIDDKVFLKITEFLDIRIGSMSDDQWVKNGKVIAKKGQKIKLGIQYLSGNYYDAGGKLSINLVVRNTNNQTVNILKINNVTLQNNELTTDEVLLNDDITVCYIYCEKGVSFDNFRIIPKIEIMD